MSGKIIILIIAAVILAGGAWWYATLPVPNTPLPGVPPPGATTTGTSGTGIQGTVTLGPTCPVEHNPPEPQCADKPYQTLVAIFPASDPVHAVAILTSTASGTFTASLPPGDYTIGAGESNLPRCSHVSVTVPQNGYASTTISCDTGIR